MGVVAPIASLGVVVPVLLGVAAGEQPPASAWVGMLLAVVGVALASGPELTGDVSPRPVVLACVAAVGFGFALFCLDRGARESLLHTLWGMRLTSRDGVRRGGAGRCARLGAWVGRDVPALARHRLSGTSRPTRCSPSPRRAGW